MSLNLHLMISHQKILIFLTYKVRNSNTFQDETVSVEIKESSFWNDLSLFIQCIHRFSRSWIDFQQAFKIRYECPGRCSEPSELIFTREVTAIPFGYVSIYLFAFKFNQTPKILSSLQSSITSRPY